MNSTPEPSLSEAPEPSLRLRLDAAALANNWRRLHDLGGRVETAAAVKADAYGLGVAQVAPVLRAVGARQFYVAHWSEAAPLLAHVPAAEVAVLHGPVTPADAAYARAVGVRPVINSLRQGALWLEAGGGPCDLMLDTGINRLGVAAEDWGAELLQRLEIDTLHSHLASADEDGPDSALQCQRFTHAAARFSARRRSLANSAGIGLGTAYRFDLTRPGLALYGGVPRADMADVVAPVVQPQVRVLQVRQVRAGERVGYNGTFAAQHDMRTATVSLGYADGYLRVWGGFGTVRFGDAVLPVIGRISMDLAIVDAGAAPGLQEGDWLHVAYDLQSAAQHTGLSQYELLTLLGRRFRRTA